MQLDEEPPLVVVSGQFVDGETALLRDGANGFEKILVVFGARLDVHHNISGKDLADVLLNGLARGMRLLESGGARHADGHIDEIALARAAPANAFRLQNAFSVISGALDAFAQAARRDVQQCLYGTHTKTRTNPDNHSC